MNIFKKIKQMFIEEIVSTGLCPCSGKCCNKPETYCPSHYCREDVCEDCFTSRCRNCHSECSCDL